MRRFFKGLAATVLGVICLLPAGCGSRTADGCLVKAKEYADSGEWKEALKQARRAVELEPDNVSGLVFRAVASEKCGERDLALDSALQAVKINPESFAAQYTLGRLYAADPTRYSDALAPLTRAAKLRNFHDRNTLVLLSNTTTALRSPSAANWLSFLSRVAPESGNDPAFRNLLGIVWARARKPDLARQEFTRAYQLDRSNPMVVYNIGTFFDRYASNPQAGAQFYRAFLRLAGDDARYANLKSRVSARLSELR